MKRVQRGCLPFITAVYTFQVSHVFRLNGLDNLDEFPQLDGQLVGTNCTFFRGVGFDPRVPLFGCFFYRMCIVYITIYYEHILMTNTWKATRPVLRFLFLAKRLSHFCLGSADGRTCFDHRNIGL